MLKRVNWEITYRCNLRCDFCFLRSAGKHNASGPELDAGQAQAFIDSAAGPRVDFYVTGGEPFARPDCLDILERIKAKGGRCGVNTNGTLLDGRKLERLAGLGLDYVIFSLHGPPATQDELCGRTGVFYRVAQNIRELSGLARAGTEIIVSCTLEERNWRDLERFFLLCRELGAHRVIFEHLQFLFPSERRVHARRWKSFSTNPGGVITPCRRRKKLDTRPLRRQLARLARGSYQGTHFDIRPRLTPARLDRWYNGHPRLMGGCAAAQEVMVVSPNGDARLCQLYDEPLGNVAASGWEEIWRGPRASEFRGAVSAGLFPGCARCCQRFKIDRNY